MSKYLGALAGIFFLLSRAFAQAPSAPAPDLSHEAYVFELISSKVVYENDGTGSTEVTFVVRIQSDAGVQEFRVLTRAYQDANESAEVSYVRVKKSDGSVIITPPENIQDMPSQITRDAPLYSDIREKHVTVKGLGVGDRLEYQWRFRLSKPLDPGQFWFDYNFFHNGIALKEEVEVSVPRGRALKLKSPALKPEISDSGSRHILRWTSSNLVIKKADDDPEKALRVQRGLQPEPDIRLSTFQSWEEVGHWYASLQEDRIKPTPEIQAKSAELTKGASDDTAKLHALYNYVSLQFHYVGVDFGIGRYQPHAASDVLSNQYGDCKDKHTLLAALASAAGIKISPALISFAHDVDSDVPSPAQFDHVISAFDDGKKIIFLDTTAEVAPFGFLLASLRGKNALVMPVDKPAALVRTPADPPFNSTQEVHLKAKLSSDGVLDGTFERWDRGDTEYVLRSAFRRISQTQWNELAQNISYVTGFGGTVSNVQADSPEATDRPFHFSYSYHRTNFGGDWENHRITPPVPVLLLPLLKDDDKKSPYVWLGSPGEIHLHSEVELPKGFAPELPSGVDLKRNFAEYKSYYAFKDGSFIVDATLHNSHPEVLAEEFDNYRSLIKAIENDRNQYVTLNTQTNSRASNPVERLQRDVLSLPDSENADALSYEAEAREHAAKGEFRTMLNSMKQAVGADPKFTRGWLVLAQSYMMFVHGSGSDSDANHDHAIDALNKAIASDPKQPLSYKLLGYTLMQDRNYKSAVKTWSDLIALSPGDQDAHANLANALFELKRYSEAVTTFKAAIELGSDTAYLEGRLAAAYLHAGNQEESRAAFKKALELNPGANTENDIAYELAEQNVQLPDALQYALQAVRSVEDETAKYDLDALTDAEMRRMYTLAAYWDTLGWVYFRTGNLKEAEQYLSAAWRLSQDAVTGDHLGQVYEKEGKTAAAVHTYHLVIATQNAPDGTVPRLARLTSAGKPTNKLLATNGSEELSRMRSLTLARVVQGDANAEFFVLLAPESGVQDVKFIKGSEKLRSADKVLRTAKFDAVFPETSVARIVRRGILSCYQVTGCSFVVYPIASARSEE